MSDIKLAREKLEILATELESQSNPDRSADEMAAWAEVIREDIMPLMYWKKSARKIVKAQSATMTPDLRNEIKSYVENNSKVAISTIASHFNVNQGRVSEVINGKWDHL